MDDLVPKFEKATGHKVVIEYNLAAVLKQRIEGGTAFDLAILTPPLVDDLIKQGKMAADSRTMLARSGLGLLIRTGGSQARHQHDGCLQADTAGGKVHRVRQGRGEWGLFCRARSEAGCGRCAQIEVQAHRHG